MEIPFVGQSYKGRSISIDVQECINFYLENELPDSNSKSALIGTPGLEAYVNLTGEIRCVYQTSTNRLFVAAGLHVYEIYKNVTANLIGTLATSQGVITMADNGSAGNQLVIADGKYGYIYNYKFGTFTAIKQDPTDENASYPGGTHIVYIDTRFLCNQPGTNKFFWSDQLDGTIWNALNFKSSESTTDVINSIVKVNNQLWMFGDQKTEIFWDAGADANGSVDFQRVDMAILDIGTSAKYSPATNGSTVFWLGSNNQGKNTVWMNQGYVPYRISTHAIENLIGKLVRVDDAIGFCYQQEGHMFYVLNFLTGDRTFVYDQTTGAWHERSTWDATLGKHRAWRAKCHAVFNNFNYVGDSDGHVMRMDLDVYKDLTGVIRRERICQHVHADRKRIFYKSFEVDLERGVGNPVDPDPQAMITWSDDGGYTWSKEYWHPLGVAGEHLDRIHWHKLGMARDRVFRFAISAAVKVVLLGAFVDAYIEKYDYPVGLS